MRWVEWAAVAVVCVGCSPSHLELARRHQRNALAAQVRGDEVQRRTETEATIDEARRSVAGEEEGERAPQAWLLSAWARVAQLADHPEGAKGRAAALDRAELALGKLRETGMHPERGWQRRLLVATHCALGAERGWAHWAALCFDHLEAVSADDRMMRTHAAVELTNAHAREKPGYLDLTMYDPPLFRRLLGLAQSDPLNADVLRLLASRLAMFCRDDDFLRDVHGWRALRGQLLEAAVAWGLLSGADAKAAAERARAAEARRPLCAAQVGSSP